eukprot:Nk52_evm7s2604 gene=Nk52_evmTU7s2604
MAGGGVNIMSPEEAAEGKPSEWWALDMGGNTICNLSESLFQFTHLTGLYLNNNSISNLPAGIGLLTSLTSLDISNNLLTSVPREIGQLVLLRELLLFNNNLSTLPFEMGRLFKLQNVGLAGNPLNEPLMELSLQGGTQVRQFLMDNSPPPPAPPDRQFIPITPSENMPPINPRAEVFTVFSYNILCDKYATTQMYGYTPTWALDWEYRRQRIIREIIAYGGDIVALQEVATDQFQDFFLPELRQHGYGGVFHPKSRARTMSQKEKKDVDGCCIFYRSSRYSVVDQMTLEFGRMATAVANMSDQKIGEDMLNRVMSKDNVGVILLLESKLTKSVVCVANAHVHWNPEFKDVKVIQTAMLMEEIKKMFLIKYGRGNFPPIVICGDFNSLPDSGVYQYLSEGHISPNHSDFEGRKYGSYLSKGLSHPFNLKSAYSVLGELPFTNYTYDFKGVIDYIFYSQDRLFVSGLVGGVNTTYMENTFLGCPNAHFPSDHISLMTEFKLLK